MNIETHSFLHVPYRFGFQGQEAEDELYGEGNASFFKYRISDNRLGRFFAVDPLAAKYPYNSTYAFSENSTIAFIELEGLEKTVTKWVLGQETAISSVSWESLYPGEEHGQQGTGTLNEIYKKDDNGELKLDYTSYSSSWDDILNSWQYQWAKSKIVSEAIQEVEENVIKYVGNKMGYASLMATNFVGKGLNLTGFLLSSFEAHAPEVHFEPIISKYNVIGGSFKNKENAERYAEENKGTVMSPTDDGFYRVSLMETYSEEKATAKQTELNDAGSDSWILQTEETINTNNVE